jgi:WD40 repeat protein
MLASCSEDGTVKLWSVPSWKEVATLQGHVGPVYSVEFAHDNATLVSGGQDGIIRIWNIGKRSQESTYDIKSGAITGIIRLPTRHTFLLRFVSRKHVCVLDIENGSTESMPSGDSLGGTVESTVVFNTSPVIAVGGTGGACAILNLDRRDNRTTVDWLPKEPLQPAETRRVMTLAISADDRTLASSLGFKVDSVVILSDLTKRRTHSIIECHDGTIWAVRFSPNGRRVACAGRRLHVCDIETGVVLVSLDADGGTDDIALMASVFAYSLCYSPDGKWLASGGSSDNVALWEWKDPAK